MGPGLVELIPRRCGYCSGLFAVCVGCFRGQSYCDEPCREEARREQHNEANRKYQLTPEGAENHRRRQRQYRRRLSLGVTDQATGMPASTASSLSQQEQGHGREGTQEDQAARAGFHCWSAEPEAFCAVCGRAGRFMEGSFSPGRWPLP